MVKIIRVSDVTITDLDRPVVGNRPDTTFTISNSKGFTLTGSAQWWKYVNGVGRPMSSGAVFEKGATYSCRMTVNTTTYYPFKYTVNFDSHYVATVSYGGTLTVNGENQTCTMSEDMLTLSFNWWDKEPLSADSTDCGGNLSKCSLTQFTDAPKYSNWAHKGIEHCVSKGLMNGTSATLFAPKTSMTRAMLVTVLYRMEGQPGAGSSAFTDVKSSAWYYAAVTWAADQGIVSGVGNGKFNPNGNVTREQIATILYRYAGFKGYGTAKQDNLTGFADSSKVGKWYVDAMKWAVAEGLINGSAAADGKTYLNPQGDATREQIAAILMRFCENVAK